MNNAYGVTLLAIYVLVGLATYVAIKCYNLPPISTINEADAKYNNSMKNLCDTYRKWTLLPEVNEQVPEMEEICKGFK